MAEKSTASTLSQGPTRLGKLVSINGGLPDTVLENILQFLGNPPVKLVLWNGKEIAPKNIRPEWTVQIKSPKTVAKLVMNPFLEIGDAFSAGEIEVEGDFRGLLERLFTWFVEDSGESTIANRWSNFINKPRANTILGSKSNIRRHYDIGNDFYKLWLDENMMYTCAYFPDYAVSLEEAQNAKCDLICRKLRLKPGQTVIDIGSGWGGLGIFMAKNYGVKYRGYNISKEQVELSRERVKAAGLDGQVEFVLDDYRNGTGEYDAFVSVGMLEHVGPNNYHQFGALLKKWLKPGGLGLMHTIGRTQPGPLGVWFERRIFPGAVIPALSEICELFEPFNLAMNDVENLRLHYAHTLTHWLERYEEHVGKVRAMYDENFVRMWRLYLSASIASFKSGFTQLYQVLFSHTGNRLAPMRRDYLVDDGQYLINGGDRS